MRTLDKKEKKMYEELMKGVFHEKKIKPQKPPEEFENIKPWDGK